MWAVMRGGIVQMSEQPEQQNPADHEGSAANTEDFGTVSFGRVSGGTLNGLPYLSTLDYHFDDGVPDQQAGGRAFASAITALHGALASYRSVVAALGIDAGRSFIAGNEDSGLLAASDHVQEAFERLGLSHRAWTGHSFLPGPLYRDVPEILDDPVAMAQLLEAEEQRADDQASSEPRLDELPVTVMVDEVLHQSQQGILRLDTVRVHSNGVLLEFNYVNLRGAHEDAVAWYRRSNELLSGAELDVELRDPSAENIYPGEINGGDAGSDRACYRLNHRFWIHRALEARELTGSVTVNNLPDADGNNKPLRVDFTLDISSLKDAVPRVRRLGNHERPA
ncbi:hypothetical protein CGQ24_11345 [Arthrobacter sp. 7749]|nr:hypothetical protein CGQ24_11345 [Arthrobacter sp. 7749]